MRQAPNADPFVERFDLGPSGSGLLDGLRFAVKDIIDLRGHMTGGGNPTWRETHPPAAANAVCVDQILNAGGRCVGKTMTDELAFSLMGENYHYGTPLNPRAPDRVPGGSSSGSASAVAQGLVDFALGTDTGGSVRVPAANVGSWGLRPTHGRISVAGVIPFSPTFDTVGVLAGELDVLARVAAVLLGQEESAGVAPDRVETVYLLTDAFEISDPEVREALAPLVARVRDRYPVREISLEAVGAPPLDTWFTLYGSVQWPEIWSSLGSWIESAKPEFGPHIARSFELSRTADRTRINAAVQERERLFRVLRSFLGPHDLLCLPTRSGLPPLRAAADVDRRASPYYRRTLSLTAIAGVGRLPQITLPLAESGGVPVGLSLIAAQDRDLFLAEAARDLG
ncbi:MAG: amidase [Chloroflexi bacterium]|nr:amidase [Chloroflexota bacterium]